MSTVTSLGLSAEAIEERRKAIGASDVAAILGLSPYSNAWTVWAEKRGMLTRWSGNKATRMGHLFESPVLDYAEAEQRDKFRRNVRVASQECPVVSTLDAMTSGGEPVEAKTAGITGPLVGTWGNPDTDEIPEHYLLQVHTQLLCTGAELGYVFAAIANRGVIRYRIERSETVCELLRTRLSEWWERHVVGGIEPDSRDVAFETAKRLIRVPKKVIILPSDAGALVDDYIAATEQAKAIKARAKDVKARIVLAMRDEKGYAEEGLLDDGRSVTFYETHKKTSSYRVLRVQARKRRRR